MPQELTGEQMGRHCVAMMMVVTMVLSALQLVCWPFANSACALLLARWSLQVCVSSLQQHVPWTLRSIAFAQVVNASSTKMGNYAHMQWNGVCQRHEEQQGDIVLFRRNKLTY